MSDDISIPSASGSGRTAYTHSYRSRRTGMDGTTKRLLLTASALGAALLAGMALWTFTGHGAAGVPTIEADSRPLRVRPDNPGGMTAIGVGEPGSASDAAGDLAPAAEQPDPQALLAQRQAAAPPAPAPAPAPAIAASPSPPAPAAKPPPPAPIPEPTRHEAPRSAGPMVQLAALDSETAANTEWQRLSHKFPDLLRERKPVVQRTEQGGKAFWRLRTGGFADMADATEFCQRVKAKGVGCSLAMF